MKAQITVKQFLFCVLLITETSNGVGDIKHWYFLCVFVFQLELALKESLRCNDLSYCSILNISGKASDICDILREIIPKFEKVPTTYFMFDIFC
jgi:hypothetical protein